MGGIDALARRHRLALITNRYQSQAGGTLRWLSEWLPARFENIVFARAGPGDPGRTKSAICRELGASVLIDDAPGHLDDLGDIRGILFGDYPWQADANRYVRALDWCELAAMPL